MLNPKAGQTPLASAGSSLKFGELDDSLQFHDMILDDYAIDELKKYSITTFEELYAIIRLPGHLLRQKAGINESEILEKYGSRAQSLRNYELQERYSKFEKYKYGFGAALKELPVAVEPTTPYVRESGTGSGNDEASLINDCMPPIRDQGERYTCVAFATCAVVEYAFCKSKKMKLDLSEQFQYWNCKRNDGDPNANRTDPDVSFALARRDGICKEATWPYIPRKNPGNTTYAPPPQAAVNEAASLKVAQAVSINLYRSVDELKRHVKNGFPVAIAIPVYDSWEENANSRITGNITLPLPGEQPTAGHALVIAGYADDDDFAGGGYFVVRNSWGTTQWGFDCPYGKGYGTLPYKYIELYNESAFRVEV